MSAVYIKEVGIVFLEKTYQLPMRKCETITVIDHSLLELFSAWVEIKDQLSNVWGVRIKWGVCNKVASKAQEYLLSKKLGREVGCDGFFAKNSSSVYSYLKYMGDIGISEINSLTGYTSCALIMVKCLPTNLVEVWDRFRDADRGLSPESVMHALNSNNDWVFVRFIESEEYAAVQFVGSEESIVRIEAFIMNVGMAKIDPKNIVYFINKTPAL